MATPSAFFGKYWLSNPDAVQSNGDTWYCLADIDLVAVKNETRPVNWVIAKD